MTYRANRIRDEFRNRHGHVVNFPREGQTFDDANDIYFDGKHITFRHSGFDARRSDTIAVPSGLSIGHLTDAIDTWERHMNPGYDYDNADDPTECGFGT